MKARDVVAGWPQGTSTLSAPDDRVWTLGFLVYQWPIDDLKKILDEIDDDRRYHREQALMMHEWHTKTGRYREWWVGDPRFGPIVGFTGKA